MTIRFGVIDASQSVADAATEDRTTGQTVQA